MGLQDAIKKLRNTARFDVVEETMQILRENANFIEELLQEQLSEGKDSTGAPKLLIRHGDAYDFYADWTITDKERWGKGLGKVTDVITHYMSGRFYQSIKMNFGADNFEFKSDVPYFKSIIATSGTGDDMMELNEENLRYVSQKIVIPELQKRFNKKFNGV